ncbi:MAG: hypothetical protein R3D68_07170 [Hyphomicrobiaceae bacterium]
MVAGDGTPLGVNFSATTNVSAGAYGGYTTLTAVSGPMAQELEMVRTLWRTMMSGLSLVDSWLGNVPGSLIPDPLKRYLKDPLVLDLDGDGVELISLANSNAHLDYGGDGFAERTGWVKGDARLLVFDRNGNGTVTPDAVWASEGSKRARPGCTVGNRRATNKPGCRVGNRRARNKPGCRVGNRRANGKMRGFEVLETLDTNHDGKVVSFPARLRHDAIDDDFASLRVWQDANEDDWRGSHKIAGPKSAPIHCTGECH